MTLGELKTFCTTKLGITDTAAKSVAGTFANARWKMIWDAQPWRQTRWQATISVPAGTQDVTLGTEFEFVTACRWKGQNELLPISDQAAFSINPAGYDQSGTPLGFAQIGKTTGGLVQIRLFQIPTETQNLLVLGKRKCIELTADSDTPLIPGIDPCLQAFVMGDLYQWIRQFSKAQVHYEEANALLAKMVEIETAQTSEIRRIIPMEEPSREATYSGPNYFF
jgi:hypothetical protein